MSPPVRVALLGFTPFERQHLEPSLRMLRRHKPVYAVRVDELQSCNLAVVDADHEPAIQQVLRENRLRSTVMVGSTPRPGAGAQLARPIQLPALLAALDALVAAAPPMSANVQLVHEALASLLERHIAPLAAPARMRQAASAGRPGGWPIITGRVAAPPRGRVLAVNVREDTLRFLTRELDAVGLEVQRVTGGDPCLARLKQEAYDFVFLSAGQNAAEGGEASDDLDGFHTCKLLKRLAPAQPTVPPATLVMLLADDSPVSRLRAERAGADAWLSAPWTAGPLLKIVDERALQQEAQSG